MVFVPAHAHAHASAQGKEAGGPIPPSAVGSVDATSAGKTTEGEEIYSRAERIVPAGLVVICYTRTIWWVACQHSRRVLRSAQCSSSTG